MSSSLVVGRLAVPILPLILLVAALVALAVGRVLGRRGGTDASPALWQILLLGLLAARVSFVWQWHSFYFANPWTVPDLRDGGWDPAVGSAVAVLVAAAKSVREPALRRALAGALTTAMVLGWGGAIAFFATQDTKRTLPEFTLQRLEGDAVPLKTFVGKPTIVNLWATWCPPCRREMPLLVRAQSANPAINFVFADQGEARDAIQRFLAEMPSAAANVLLDPNSSIGATFDERALPTTLFFDASGRLQATRMGAMSDAALASTLSQLKVSYRSAESKP